MSAGTASVIVAAECRCAASLNVPHDPTLGRRRRIGISKLGTVLVEDIGDLQVGSPLVLGHSSAQDYAFWCPQDVKWAFQSLNMTGTDLSVARGDADVMVTQKDLDHPDIHAEFHQVGGKAVSQYVGRHPLSEAGLG